MNLKTPSEAPSDAQIQDQLRRVLDGESFTGAVRSQQFLRFIVAETLADCSDRLHGYTIGVEALDRPEDFDPQTDPIVRVEAGRLRRRLERHYLTDGIDDPVLIEIPKGTYVPRFSNRVFARPGQALQAGIEPLDSASSTPRSLRHLRSLVIAVPVFLAAVVLAFAFWQLGRNGRASQRSGSTAVSKQTQIRTVVMPFDYETTSGSHPFLTSGLVEELIATLSTIPDVEVIAPGSAARVAEDGLTPDEIANALNVAYLIRGSVRQEDERIRVTVSVVDLASSVVRLATSFEGTSNDILDLQADVARGLARSLSETVTQEVERQLQATGMRNPEALALYHEATTLRDPPSDPVRSRLAEEAYRRVIELDPDFAGGYAGLAYVLAFRSWWGMSEQPDSDKAEALDAASTAVEKNAQFGWAQMSLSIALNVNGEHDRSLEAGRRAAALSPNDPYVLSFSGLFQVFAGDVDNGAKLAASAIQLDPLSPRTPYRNIAGATHFHAGRFDEAFEFLSENLRIGGPDGPHTRYYRAGTLARLGRFSDARIELEKADSFPYDFDMRAFLSAFRDPSEADYLFESLESVRFDAKKTSAANEIE